MFFFSDLVVVGDLALLLEDGVVRGVALGHVGDVALLGVLGVVLGVVHRLALLLVGRLALLLVDGVVDGVVHRLVARLAVVAGGQLQQQLQQLEQQEQLQQLPEHDDDKALLVWVQDSDFRTLLLAVHL